MGRCAPPVLLRPPGKMSAIRERRRSGSRRRDGQCSTSSFGQGGGNMTENGRMLRRRRILLGRRPTGRDAKGAWTPWEVVG